MNAGRDFFRRADVPARGLLTSRYSFRVLKR